MTTGGDDSKKSSQTKDLSGLFETTDPVASAPEQDSPHIQFEAPPSQETVETFESLDELPKPEAGEGSSLPTEPTFEESQASQSETFEPLSFEMPAESEPAESEPAVAATASTETSASEPHVETSLETLTETAPVPSETGVPEAPGFMAEVRKFSENSVPKAPVPASFPFSVLISGRLAPEEKEKLLDVLSRNNMGIREIDLEPQFESGKILIPRISEYAAILIVHAMKSAKAKLRFGPSDSIFSSEATREEDLRQFASDPAQLNSATSSTSSAEENHPAETLPITQQGTLPGGRKFKVLDTVSASTSLKTFVVENESSEEFQRAVDALQKELKYKAFRKGATAIVNFKIQLVNLAIPAHYRVIAMGSAIKDL